MARTRRAAAVGGGGEFVRGATGIARGAAALARGAPERAPRATGFARTATKLAVPLLATLVVATTPAAAGPADTVTEELIRTLNANLLYAAVPVTVLVEGVLIYTVWEFRESRQDGAKPTQENRLLEITWTVATAVILVFVGVASYQVLANPMVSAPPDPQPEGDPVEIDVVARAYFWTFQYDEADVEVRNELVIPTDRPIVFNVTSRDWLHSFHVPELGLKQDAFPGRAVPLLTEANTEGTYQGYCAEYCGVGHSRMMFTVEVVGPEEYEDWLADQQERVSEPDGAAAADADAASDATASNDDAASNDAMASNAGANATVVAAGTNAAAASRANATAVGEKPRIAVGSR